ncbi:acyltransferase domain-containing protein [Actinomadura madurae]|nr:acyltransferase domain-containing protein [Actinomadura madurae]MCP9972492.1 acyltransferase domain-containing protein [Actinomadura madurae]
MVQAMRHGVLSESLHIDAPSSHVDWSSGAVELLTERRAWPDTGHPRRAGVSSFGISGTNAHVVLEAAPAPGPEPGSGSAPQPKPEAETALVPWTVSGRGEAALRAQASALLQYVEARPGLDPVAVGLALSRARAAFEQRAVITAPDHAGRVAGLAALAAGTGTGRTVRGVANVSAPLAFAFPGQGPQWEAMSRDLLDDSPAYREAVERCAAALEPHVGWSLVDVLRARPGAPSLDRVDVVQPALFGVMVSLAELWRRHGVEPAAVIGHSQGEIAAACVAGALGLEDAARVVAVRSRMLPDLSGRGGMLSVELPDAEARARLAPYGDGLAIAAVNGPRAVVVSGETGALDDLSAHLSAGGVRNRRIAVDYASHSAQVEQIRDDLRAELAGLEPRPARTAFWSTVTGGWLEGTELDAEYWFRNLRETVRFGPGCAELLDQGYRAFVEVSPHPVLAMSMQDTLDERDVSRAVVTGTLRRGEGGLERFLASAAELHVRGVPVEWAPGVPDRPVADLPTYAFQRERYWPRPGGARPVGADPEEAGFWEAVDAADHSAVAASLQVETDAPLGEVVDALSARRRARRETSLAKSWRYRYEWRPLAAAPEPALHGRWLVVAAPDLDEERFAAACDAVTEAGGTPIPHRFTGDGALPADDVDGVLSLLALDDRPEGTPDVPDGLIATLALDDALDRAGAAVPRWCLTTGAVAAAGEPVVSPRQAAVWGLAGALAVHRPRRRGGVVDVPADPGARWAEAMRAVAAAGDEDEIAVRATGPLVRRLVREPGGETAGMWRPRLAVLVSCAADRLGEEVARWMRDAGGEHVVLAGPGEDLDAAIAALPDGEPLTVVHVSVSSGPLLAEPIEAAWREAWETVRLHELCDGRPVADFLVLTSLTSHLGVPWQAAAAPAAAFLDGLVQRRRTAGLPAASVHVGALALDGVAEQDVLAAARRHGVREMAPAPAAAALRLAAADGAPATAVADIDWSRLAIALGTDRPPRLFTELADLAPDGSGDAAQTSAFAADLAGLPEDARMERALGLVRAEVAAVLGHGDASAVDPDRAFRELGFDSVTAVDLRNRLGAATGVRLAATIVFDHPTPLDLAARLVAAVAGGAEAGRWPPPAPRVRWRRGPSTSRWPSSG